MGPVAKSGFYDRLPVDAADDRRRPHLELRVLLRRSEKSRARRSHSRLACERRVRDRRDSGFDSPSVGGAEFGLGQPREGNARAPKRKVQGRRARLLSRRSRFPAHGFRRRQPRAIRRSGRAAALVIQIHTMECGRFGVRRLLDRERALRSEWTRSVHHQAQRDRRRSADVPRRRRSPAN